MGFPRGLRPPQSSHPHQEESTLGTHMVLGGGGLQKKSASQWPNTGKLTSSNEKGSGNPPTKVTLESCAPTSLEPTFLHRRASCLCCLRPIPTWLVPVPHQPSHMSKLAHHYPPCFPGTALPLPGCQGTPPGPRAHCPLSQGSAAQVSAVADPSKPRGE